MTSQTRLFATGAMLSAFLLAIGLLATNGVHASDAVGHDQTAQNASADPKRAALREELRALLREEPELVIEAIDAYQRREEQLRRDRIAEALPQFIPQIEQLVSQGERVLVQGDPEGDITLIEFADYNCPVCRRVQPEIQAFLEAHPKARHVVKALAYIGSPYAEIAVVASGEQGDEKKTAAFHQRMMAHEGRLTDEKVLQIAASVGLDAKKLAADMEKDSVKQRIQRTIGIARALDIQGTPALLFPDRITSYVTAPEMAAIAKEIRAKR